MNPEDKVYPGEETLTISCDASFHPKLKKGGYAFWISHYQGSIKRSGTFHEPLLDATEAEIKAVCNAFHFIESKFGRTIKLVFVNCDNATVRSIIKGKKFSNRYKAVSKTLTKYVRKYELVIAKHINGHRPGYNSRQYVNNWCDEHSRNYLKRSKNH